ncbi:MAG: hypothetical protein ACLQPV_04990 [Vulcanimicrobiaceae bacterium]
MAGETAVKQLPYVGVAAIGMGFGVAGVPFAPLDLAAAAAAVILAGYIIENRSMPTAPICFVYGFLCAGAVAYVQHLDADVVPTVLAALAVGAAAALTHDRPKTWPLVALAGVVVGAMLFLFD